MKQKSQSEYLKMYKEIIEKYKTNVNEVGEVVILKYGLTFKRYKNNVLTSSFTNALTEEDYTTLSLMIRVVEDYEKNIINVDLPLSNKLIESYISSKYLNVKDYCDSNNLSEEVFERAKNIVFLYDRDKYNILVNEQKQKDKSRNKQITEEAENIIGLIKNGVTLENGEKREFDLIDYYECTSIPPKKMPVYINKKIMTTDIDQFQLLYLKKFLNRYNNNPFVFNPINVNDKLSAINIYDCKKDENGRLIPGTGKTISENEKIALIEYLVNNKIPLIEGTYDAGIKRIKNNTFGINEEQKNNSLVLK